MKHGGGIHERHPAEGSGSCKSQETPVHLGRTEVLVTTSTDDESLQHWHNVFGYGKEGCK
jgi:hypothetical protein